MPVHYGYAAIDANKQTRACCCDKNKIPGAIITEFEVGEAGGSIIMLFENLLLVFMLAAKINNDEMQCQVLTAR